MKLVIVRTHTYHIDFNKLNFKNARLVKLVYTADSKSVP